VGGRELTFDFAKGLLENNLLVVDRETRSIWSQLDGKAISGPMKDTPLEMIPALQTTWKHWRERHPETLVLVEPGEDGRRYLYRNRKWESPQPPMPRRPPLPPNTHDISALGLGLAIGDDAVFFPLTAMQGSPSPLTVTVGGWSVKVHHRVDAYTAWAENDRGELLTAVMVYEIGWQSFFPETRIWQPASPPAP
jgi:hypothetical protein